MEPFAIPGFVVPSLYGVVGMINLAPLVGAVGPRQLGALYGTPLQRADNNLVLLLRHRACLLGVVGTLLLRAALRPEERPVAAAVGFASMLSYMVLGAQDFKNATLNHKLTKVFWADLLACVLLGAAIRLQPPNTMRIHHCCCGVVTRPSPCLWPHISWKHTSEPNIHGAHNRSCHSPVHPFTFFPPDPASAIHFTHALRDRC